MSGRGGKKSKAQIQASKPEPPPFLQRIREQIVANEDADRRDKSDKRRLERPNKRTNDDAGDNDPTIVKLTDDDITEAEYKRMKTELEAIYKLSDKEEPKRNIDLDIDMLIKNRQVIKDVGAREASSSSSRASTGSKDRGANRHDDCRERNTKLSSKGTVSISNSSTSTDEHSKTSSKTTAGDGNKKKLSFGYSSDEDEDD